MATITRDPAGHDEAVPAKAPAGFRFLEPQNGPPAAAGEWTKHLAGPRDLDTLIRLLRVDLSLGGGGHRPHGLFFQPILP